MSKRSSENTCKWFEDIFELNEDFRKSYNDESDKTYFMELMFIILKIYITFTMIYPFCLKE